MENKKLITAIGLMSGTSMDGIDIALMQSDGRSIIRNKKFDFQPYSKEFKEKIIYLIRSRPSLFEIKKIENEFTMLNANLINSFLASNNIDRSQIDLISFPGHTIFHDPREAITWQIGNADLLEARTKIHVISNFRTFDVANNGQGAPLVPVYHFFMLKNLPKPSAILNIGGVNNITYIPSELISDMTAFDICFGNAPFDDLMSKYTDFSFDIDGKIGLSGEVNHEVCEKIIKNEIFYRSPPKSFDRDDFRRVLGEVQSLSLPDSLASLSYIHANVVLANLELFTPEKPKSIYICGGGVKNKSLIKFMKDLMPDIEMKSTSAIGYDPDKIEAQAFAFIGIRKLLGLPISFQKTTGISPETDFFPVFSQH